MDPAMCLAFLCVQSNWYFLWPQAACNSNMVFNVAFVADNIFLQSYTHTHTDEDTTTAVVFRKTGLRLTLRCVYCVQDVTLLSLLIS